MSRIRNLACRAVRLALEAALAAVLLMALAGPDQPDRSDIEPRLAALESSQRALEARQAEPVRERIIELPEDGHTWHTILFLRADWQSRPEERRAHSSFFSDPGLVSLREQTHWHVITTEQPEFRPFAQLVDATPCLVVERANGQVIYRESGPQLGRNSAGLKRAIQREVERHCPDGRCLPLHPVPDHDRPRHDEEEIPAVLREETPPPERRFPTGSLLALAGGLAGGAVGRLRRG